MIAALMGLPGKVKTLIDRLTATRASNLDNLDAAVTTRAAASTALSTATWTNTRAGYLDALNGASPFTGIVQSIQYGVVTIANGQNSGTATITAVTTAKTMLIHLGFETVSRDGYITLTNTTTVTATRSGTTGTQNISFCAVQFK